jgi:hypothetical protein
MAYRRLVHVTLSEGKDGPAYQYDTQFESVLYNLDGTILTWTAPFTAVSNGVVADKDLPQWYFDMGNEKFVQKEELKIQYKAALRSGAVKDTDPVEWAAEVALE